MEQEAGGFKVKGETIASNGNHTIPLRLPDFYTTKVHRLFYEQKGLIWCREIALFAGGPLRSESQADSNLLVPPMS
jgi:hypothetical protein